MELTVYEHWQDVAEEFRGLHHRLSILLRSQIRQSSHAAMEGRSSPEEYVILKELLSLKADVEWHLIQADLDSASSDKPEIPSVQSLGQLCVHALAQPVLHTRLVSNEEVRENLARWAPAMKAEFRSLLAKGAIEQVSDDQVQGWISAGENIEVLPGRGVPTEKPPSQPGGAPREIPRCHLWKLSEGFERKGRAVVLCWRS